MLAIIPDVSQTNPKLTYKLVPASEYSKLKAADKQKYNYGILVKNVFTGGQYDEDKKKIMYGTNSSELPISTGDYNILENKGNTEPSRNNFFVLDPQDARPYNKIDDRKGEKNAQGTYRSGYNLHPGKVSHGCVTVCKADPKLTEKERAAEWNTVFKEITSTTGKQDVDDNRGNNSWIPFTSQVKYGTLRVIDSKPVKK